MADSAKILVVDDDPDVVEATQLVLEAKGYQVVTAASAEEGLAQAAAERPDLILLDVMMPEGTEGFHFVWTLRRDEDPQLRDTPIIILSGIHDRTKLRFYPDQSDGTYGPYEYLPVQEFLDKPVAPAELVEAVNSLVARGRERQQTTLKQ